MNKKETKSKEGRKEGRKEQQIITRKNEKGKEDKFKKGKKL